MLLLASVLGLGGCAVESSTPYDCDFFRHPPEIWERGGIWHVRIYEPEGDPTGYGIAVAEVHGKDVQVWLYPRHSSGSNPNRLLPLDLPVAAGAPPTFLWRDPDGTLHPLKVRRA